MGDSVFVLDPDETLRRVALLCVLVGVGWAGLAALVIYLGATRMPPRIAHGQVWAQWRRRRVLWIGALALCAAGALGTAEVLCRGVAFRDLYWLSRPNMIPWIWRLGALTGFVLLLSILTVAAALQRAAARPPRAATKDRPHP